MSDLANSKEAMVAAYAGLAKALKTTHKTVVEFQKALEGVDPARAADLLRDMPKMPTFGGDDDGKPGKKAKKEKKEKDPNAPKRPPSAYLEYQNSVRDDIRAANQGMAYAEVLRKIAAAWGEMPDKEKKTWTDLTAKRTEEYEKVKAAYAETLAAQEGDASAKPAKGVEVEASAGKKRGRRSEADKKREQEDQLAKIAAAVDTPSVPKEKKKKAVAAAQAATPAKAAPAPAPVSSSSEESSEDDSSDDDSSDESSDDEPAPPPVKKSSKKDKKADEPTKKKAKH